MTLTWTQKYREKWLHAQFGFTNHRGHDVPPPYELWGVSDSNGGNLPGKILTRPNHPTSKKALPLHYLRPLDHKSHIECTSPPRSKIQYIGALPSNK